MAVSTPNLAPTASFDLAEGSNPLEGLLGYQLRRTSLAVGADLTTRLEPLSLTVITLSVLLLIEANPGVTQSEIGRRLGIKRANMAPLAGQLSERGLINRVRFDGRSNGLSLTGAGALLAESAWLAVHANEARFLNGMTPGAQAALSAALVQMRSAGSAAR